MATRIDQSYKRLIEAEGSGAPPTTPRCAAESYGSGPAVSKFSSPSGRSPGGEPPRLFDAIASQPEPSDMHDYYSHCRGFTEVVDANARTLLLQRIMFGICTTQVICACAFTSMQDKTPNSTGKALMLISSVVSLISGMIGFTGAWKKSTMALNWFFISQLWCISVVLTQFLRGQLTESNEQIFCSHDMQHNNANALCGSLAWGWVIGFSSISLATVYSSVFFTDALVEALQDQLEKEDTLLITKFVWLMQKKTTVGIHRFEDLIHKEFQELVEMGYLKLKPNASKPNSPNS